MVGSKRLMNILIVFPKTMELVSILQIKNPAIVEQDYGRKGFT
jgi:hypothetical protein